MSTWTKETLQELVAATQKPRLSLFMPTIRAGAQTQQNPIRFKNLMREAEEQLRSHGLSAADTQRLLEPLQELHDDDLFWQQQRDGLAVFRSYDLLQVHRVQLNLDELVVVGDRFHTKPLLPLLVEDGEFYVLALSRNAVRLLKGTRDSVDEVDLQDVPRSLAEALQYDDFEKQLQWHTGTGGQGARGTATNDTRAAMFHGQGANKDAEKSNLMRYFKEIDKGLVDLLADRRTPLVLAGVDYLLPMYRDQSNYRSIVEEGVTGNPDTLRPDELHAEAWKVVEPIFASARAEAVRQFMDLSNTDRAATDLRTILPAAAYGRVDRLFVALNEQRWGRFNPETNEVVIHDRWEPGDEDLIDLAALHTLLNSGTVFAVERDQVPGGKLLAAIMRY